MVYRTLGIVTEYNPFHEGHFYQLKKVKRKLAETVIIVMSGDFVQRGEPAILEAKVRAQLAIEAGADLVIKMPHVASTSSAESFAYAGVSLLEKTGICEGICFGAEWDDPGIFSEVASLLLSESDEFKDLIKGFLKSGESFPVARSKALALCSDNPKVADFLSTPNNILGVEYVKAIMRQQSRMDFVPIKRNGSYKSSSEIRNAIFKEGVDAVSGIVPDITFNALKEAETQGRLKSANDFSLLMHQAFIANEDFDEFLDGSVELSGRLKNKIGQFTTIEDFALNELKTKNYTYTRVMRFLLHIMLNIRQSDFDAIKAMDFAPYIEVLAVKEDRKDLLSLLNNNARVPVFFTQKEADRKLSKQAMDIYKKDRYAKELYRIV